MLIEQEWHPFLHSPLYGTQPSQPDPDQFKSQYFQMSIIKILTYVKPPWAAQIPTTSHNKLKAILNIQPFIF